MAATRRQVANKKEANGYSSDSDGVRKQLQSVRRNVANEDGQHAQSLFSLLICAGGIYASFLTWGVLQERITKTNYGTSSSPEYYDCAVVINTVQSTFAALLGYVYLRTTRKASSDLPIFPSREIILPMSLVAITSSLASPFGYASLQHVDYITFTLAKSCKLIPVMALHVTLFRRKYPLYKYAVVALVTAGVAVFTLHHPSSSSSSSKNASKPSTTTSSSSSAWGLLLLSINLLFDGLTNSTQDHIYKRYKGYTGQQMMCALNLLSTALTTSYLLAGPVLLARSPRAVTNFIGLDVNVDGRAADELRRAVDFVAAHPAVGRDILLFGACGALGQVFIFYTLATFGSLLLVTLTVTRKMLTMIISVVWFGHRLTGMQWVGVGFVFAGIGLEAELSKREKRKKVPEKTT